MLRFNHDSPDEVYRPRPPTDGGYPVDSDLHQMSDDGCPHGPNPARWADPDWRDDPAEKAASGHDNLGEMDTFDGELDDPARRREFGELADGFSARVRSGPMGPETGVWLIFRYADRQGNGFTRRASVTPSVFEADVHRDAVIGAIQALVLAAPTGWAVVRDGPGPEVRIAGFDLEIAVAG
jgi:hypothetical protein